LPRKNPEILALLLAPVPSLTVGVSVMRGGGIATGIWVLNVIAAVVGISLAWAALVWPKRVSGSRGLVSWLPPVGLALLGATLLAPGTEGVHRWLPLGPVRIHAGALLLPPLLVALWEASWVTSAIVALAVLLVLSLQPDAAQATSFCAAWVGMAGVRRGWKAMPAMIVSFLVAAACLLRPDPLEPVPHVEGIVEMAATQGSMLAAAGLLSLAALPLAFVLFLERPIGIVLALYTVGTLIAAWLGNYPVPILGYGVSPVLGYYGAVVMCVLLCRPGEVLSSETAAAF
jgi:hypothetical protein